MKFPKLNSNTFVNININKYRLDWNNIKGSGPEIKFQNFIKPYWRNYVVLKEFRIPGSRLRCDFLNVSTKTAVEVSPRQHIQNDHWFYGGSKLKYKDAFIRDINKITYLQDKLGYTVLELYDEDLDNLSAKYIKEKFNIEL